MAAEQRAMILDFKSVDCSGGGGCGAVYSVSPNPASAKVIIVPQMPAPCIIVNANNIKPNRIGYCLRSARYIKEESKV